MSTNAAQFFEALAANGGALGKELESHLAGVAEREKLAEAMAAFAQEKGFALTAADVAHHAAASGEFAAGAELSDADLERVAGGSQCLVSMGGRCVTWWAPPVNQFQPKF